ncbi:response regulator [Gallaecimonas xiamenensis]|uniref:Response regulator receiver protein n=1 Tax=Gallaecimonas xiamenensis 3-C-1 TaxID=745411 RepID=K2JMQ7_9GAMM|nr:response regulator [Gallaecimonas xiamenensis]EKE75677.1 response regulator receiver protein [Gallaecimonas xiamenensis 3-C-1]
MTTLVPADLSLLLVEPSETQRRVIIRHLASEGIHRIDDADGVKAALAHIRHRRPDLVLSALHFADGTALELVRTMRSEAELKDTPFVLVSSERRPDELEAFKQSGVAAILPKPFTHEQLGLAINATLDLLSPNELELTHFDTHSLRVLVVDDSRMARRHITRVLENLGISQITEAVDGNDAIHQLSTNMFDLVVTDYNMPNVNGRELTEHIRQQSDQSHVPVLMVTSEANGAHLANIAQSGVDAICDKPFEPAEVRALLYRLLEQ